MGRVPFVLFSLRGDVAAPYRCKYTFRSYCCDYGIVCHCSQVATRIKSTLMPRRIAERMWSLMVNPRTGIVSHSFRHGGASAEFHRASGFHDPSVHSKCSFRSVMSCDADIRRNLHANIMLSNGTSVSFQRVRKCYADICKNLCVNVTSSGGTAMSPGDQ